MITFNLNDFTNGGRFDQCGVTSFCIAVTMIPKALDGFDGISIETMPVLDIHTINQLEGIKLDVHHPAENGMRKGWIYVKLDGKLHNSEISFPPSFEKNIIAVAIEGMQRFRSNLESLFVFAELIIATRISQWIRRTDLSPEQLEIKTACPGCNAHHCPSPFIFPKWELNTDAWNYIGGAPCSYPQQFQQAFNNYVSNEARTRFEQAMSVTSNGYTILDDAG